MTRNLSVAVLDYSPGWELLLEQIGLPCRALHNVNELAPETIAVTIVNRHLWSEELDALEAYVRAGGAILDIGRFLPCRESARFRRTRVRSALVDEEELTGDEPFFLDLYSRALRLRRGGTANGLIAVEPRGNGLVAFLGFDPGQLMLSKRMTMKRFPGLAGEYPAERVGLVSKGEIESLVRRLLIRLYHAQGLPFVRKRSFPRDAENVLCFRIDTDYGSRGQIDALYDLARRTETAMTWFLHVEAHTGWLDRFKEFEGQELALHCRRHRTFPGFEENHANIVDGLAALRREGIAVEGFSAPNGIWNDGLAAAIDDQNFLYSSEFTLAYDALPFRPILPIGRRVNSRFYNAFQIPIHPVSVGNLLRLRMGENRMVDYYRSVIDRKARSGDPLIFYHHPTHERWEVMEALLTEAKERNGRSLTFAEYAGWWKKRERMSLDAEFSEGRITVYRHDADPSVWLDVFYPDGTTGMISGEESGMNERILEERRKEVFETSPELDFSPGIREFSLKMKRRTLHDWIIRTSR